MSKVSIFISHATPEDNDFVRWLGARLELAGYQVWHDLARLKGGDYFWDKIENAIRNDTYLFVAVVSQSSIGKQGGVKDEWALGLTLEKSMPGFVLPIRIDSCDFSLLPIGLNRKNVIDFWGGWHKGLGNLLDTLSERHAPRVCQPDPRSARYWLPETSVGAVVRTSQRESLDSTWLRIISMPPALETARFLGSERGIKVTEKTRLTPWFEHEDKIYGFAKSSDLVALMAASAMLEKSNAIDLETFIERNGKFGSSYITQVEAQKRVLNLMRQAWELAMEAKGLRLYIQSGGKKVHYITPELTGGRGEYISFVDVDGRRRKKALNGRSEKRKANWCYGIGITPSLDAPRRIEVRPTIVFTNDDGNPLDPVHSQRVRMSFCRNWWNDRWRGFLRAFLEIVSAGQREIRLPVGSGRFLVVDASPIIFSSPTGLSDLPPSAEPELSIEDELAAFDGEEGEEGLDDEGEVE